MASAPTPAWVKVFIGLIALIVLAVVILHLTGVMPRMHHMS